MYKNHIFPAIFAHVTDLKIVFGDYDSYYLSSALSSGGRRGGAPHPQSSQPVPAGHKTKIKRMLKVVIWRAVILAEMRSEQAAITTTVKAAEKAQKKRQIQ